MQISDKLDSEDIFRCGFVLVFFWLEAALRRYNEQELDNWISVKIVKEVE